jgi:hypothetical protein
MFTCINVRSDPQVRWKVVGWSSGLHTLGMAKTHKVQSIEGMPIYLVSAEPPWVISEDDFVDNVPLGDLITRISPGEHLYLVDYASVPGQTRLTCLV